MLDVHEKCRVGQTGQPYNDQQALHKSSQKRNVGQRSNPADDNMNSSSSHVHFVPNREPPALLP